MDFPGRLVGRRVVTDRVCVVRLAVRQRRRGDVLAGRGQVVPREIRVQLQIGRENLVGDPPPPLDSKGFPVRLGNSFRKFLERLVVRALFRVGKDLCADRVRDVAKRHCRLHPSLLLPAFHQSDRLVDLFRKGGEPGEVVAVVLRGTELRQGRQDREVLVDALLLVDRHELRREPRSLDRALEVPRKKVERQPVVFGQGLAIDLLQTRERVLGVLVAPFDCFRGEVGQAVVVARVAQGRGPLRELLQTPLPLLVEELRQVFRRRDAFRRGRGGTGARALHRPGRGHDRKEQQQRRKEPHFFHRLPSASNSIAAGSISAAASTAAGREQAALSAAASTAAGRE